MSAHPVPSPELCTAMTGLWKVDTSKSDSLEPLLVAMGAPWLVRKMINNSGPPQQRVALHPDRLEVSSVGSMMGSMHNRYVWGTGNPHHTAGGTYTASLDLEGGGSAAVVTVDVPKKGEMVLSYSAATAGPRQLHLTITMTPPGGTAKLFTIHRYLDPVAE